MGKGFLDYDAVTTNDLLRTVKENKNRFPLDSDLNEFSEKLLPNSVISREINKIKDATSNNKGYFLNVESLKDAYPTTNEGSKAYVGNSYPYMIYLFQGGEWINSGQAGGDDTFNAGDFYTKLQIDQQREVINGEISRVENGANYEVLEYEINIATTRLKVDEKNRKGGYMITYNPGTGWIKEQYIGLSVTNEEWIKDENWKPEILNDSIQAIAENAQKQADLAAKNAAYAKESGDTAYQKASEAADNANNSSNIASKAASDAISIANEYGKRAESIAQTTSDEVKNSVLLKSQQSLSDEEKAQVKMNLGVDAMLSNLELLDWTDSVGFDIYGASTSSPDIPKSNFAIVSCKIDSTDLIIFLKPKNNPSDKTLYYENNSLLDRCKLTINSVDTSSDSMYLKFYIESKDDNYGNLYIDCLYYPSSKKEKFKGYFSDSSELSTTNIDEGSYAYVGNPKHLYLFKDGSWSDNGVIQSEVDSVLDIESENPVANKEIVKKFNEVEEKIGLNGGIGQKFLTGNGGWAEIFNNATRNKSEANHSHVEGVDNEIKQEAEGAHVEGYGNICYALHGHVEGNSNKIERGCNDSHAEGCNNIIIYETIGEKLYYANFSHVEGYGNKILGSPYAHSEGYFNIAKGNSAHVQGKNNLADGVATHCGGENNKARTYCETVFGCYNSYQEYPNQTSKVETNPILSLGNGSSEDSRNNAFEVLFDGSVRADGGFNSPSADYAEMFEWYDGNTMNEDRVGRFVSLKENKIVLSKNGDLPVGIVSASPSVIGDNPMRWRGKYLDDEWGRPVYEDVKVTYYDTESFTDENGDTVTNTVEKTRVDRVRKINPDYVPEQEYVPRSNRKEWASIGLIGKLLVRHDGTLFAGGMCKPSENGIATNSETGYYVMEVRSNNIAMILFK